MPTVIGRQLVADHGVKYMPSPEEIKEQCLEIQARWSDTEKNKRAGCYGTKRILPLDQSMIKDLVYDLDDMAPPSVATVFRVLPDA